MSSFQFKLVDDDTYCIMKYEGNESEVVVPDNYCSKPVTIIFDDVFKNHTEITKVTFPDTITNIGGFVFDGCINLKHVVLPPNLTDMWQYAFVRCGIEEIEIPSTIRSIVPFTFQDCSHLKKVICNTGLQKIHAWAFKDCINLHKIVVPENVQVDTKAFVGCAKLNYNFN